MLKHKINLSCFKYRLPVKFRLGITYGPDDSLWVTENVAYKVSKINIADGGKTELLDLSNVKINFTTFPQGGLMGMALNPTLYSQWPNASKPWVYLA